MTFALMALTFVFILYSTEIINQLKRIATVLEQLRDQQ